MQRNSLVTIHSRIGPPVGDHGATFSVPIDKTTSSRCRFMALLCHRKRNEETCEETWKMYEAVEERRLEVRGQFRPPRGNEIRQEGTRKLRACSKLGETKGKGAEWRRTAVSFGKTSGAEGPHAFEKCYLEPQMLFGRRERVVRKSCDVSRRLGVPTSLRVFASKSPLSVSLSISISISPFGRQPGWE